MLYLLSALLLMAAAPARRRAAEALHDMESGSVILVGSASCDYCTDEVTELVSLHARKREAKITAFLQGSPGEVANACASRHADFRCTAISAYELSEVLRAENGAEPLIRVRSARGVIVRFNGSTSVRRLAAALEDR